MNDRASERVANYEIMALEDHYKFLREIAERPSVKYKPSLKKDGNAWIVLYGEDLQTGVCGSGYSPDEAMKNFDENWIEKQNEVTHGKES
jgi:hypothetical protein